MVVIPMTITVDPATTLRHHRHPNLIITARTTLFSPQGPLPVRDTADETGRAARRATEVNILEEREKDCWWLLLQNLLAACWLDSEPSPTATNALLAPVRRRFISGFLVFVLGRSAATTLSEWPQTCRFATVPSNG